MDDKTLLELAAKATGYLVAQPSSSGNRRLSAATKVAAKCKALVLLDGRDEFGDTYLVWNPLEDDGDALRLAVKLYLFSSPVFYHHLGLERLNNNDEYAAARRAIVRVAAAIGELQ